MHNSQLPEDTTSDYAFILQFFASMHPRLQQEVETLCIGDKDINAGISIPERLDSIHRSKEASGKEGHANQPKESAYKKPEHQPKKIFNNNGNYNKKKEPRKNGGCFTCWGGGHMAKDYRSKKDKGKAKVKKEAVSNLATEHIEYEEVYINALEFESYAAAKTNRLTRINTHHALEGRMFINGQEAKVPCDTGMIEANLISPALVTTHGIPCTVMKEPTKILMAIKGTLSKSHKECTVDLAVGKLHPKSKSRC